MLLVVATSNPHKQREIRALLAGVPIKMATLEQWGGVEPPAETGATFDQNARLKALYYAQVTGELVVAEDSGLEIDALDGAPGVESARFGGEITYPEKFALIYRALRDRRVGEASARFVCALALARGSSVLFESRGTIEGRIAAEPRGNEGFGYDPIFFYPPYNCTLAEATAEQKAAVSHRARAFRGLQTFLDSARL